MNPGDLISGKYRLLHPLGAGGMGSVWAARNELTDRDFAIKFLRHDLASNKEALQRFFLEARACGQIKHPAVVNVYDMGQADDGSPYLVMELLEGEGFDQRLARAGVFRPAEAAAWIAFVARGLEEAHVRGLVHRDLKPGNIFFALDDRGDIIPKVLDFGVSKAVGPRDGELFKTMTGAVLGSPAYMSPEQARGDLDIDGRSDIWSLGVILYEALTGKVPFDAPNYNALMVSIITKDHVPVEEVAPGVPKDLSQIVDQALSKDRNKRMGTARELADRLESVAMKLSDAPFQHFPMMRTPTFSGGPSPLHPTNRPPPTPTQNAWSDQDPTLIRHRRSPLTYVVAGLAAATLVVAGVVVFLQMRPPMAAVAGRSSMALTTSLSRLKLELERTRADAAEADRKAKEAAEAERKAREAAEANDPKKAADRPAAAGSAKPSASPAAGGKPRKDNPHGGVDSAGF